ncbi:hypothetical protein MML48_1g20391 [Holotrichia oblita]|uniref:Uncharacterized protein n=1 Tax=Holotrichia oblita TaxID=644536 RepID=A0ACB9TUP5_HOLOL|nr:hypothetical protein MML48_1g20391 [Holotrichia oblita]
MALSQKHSGKILVPWYSSHEWKYVYSLIYSETSTQSDKKKALEILQIWKIRMPILFAGLEGTLIILNAMLHDGTTFTKDQLSSFYALAIMRFLNLCAANSDQQGTFFRIAKERNLPEWLVSIRHDLAHSQKQSSLFMLRKGIEYCFEWLKYEYWELQDRKITDFLVSTVTSDDIEEKIHLYTIEQIPNLYVVKWEPVFQYLSDYNMLMNIILKLHEICRNNEDLLIEKISSLWLKEIFAGLSTNGKQNQHNIISELLNYTNLKSTYQSVAPNQKRNLVVIHQKFLNFGPQNAVKVAVCDLLEKKQKTTECKEFDCHKKAKFQLLNRAILCSYNYFKVLFYKVMHPGENVNTSLHLIVVGVHVVQPRLQLASIYEYSFHDVVFDFGFSATRLRGNGSARIAPYQSPRTVSACCPGISARRSRLMKHLYDNLKNLVIMRCRILILSLKITLLENVKEAIGVDTFEGLSFTVDRTLPTPPKNWTKIEDTCNYEGCPIGILPYQSRDRNPTISF